MRECYIIGRNTYNYRRYIYYRCTLVSWSAILSLVFYKYDGPRKTTRKRAITVINLRIKKKNKTKNSNSLKTSIGALASIFRRPRPPPKFTCRYRAHPTRRQRPSLLYNAFHSTHPRRETWRTSPI